MGTQQVRTLEMSTEVLDKSADKQTVNTIHDIINSFKVREQPQKKLDLAEEKALLQKYAPILYFHKEESSWPSTVEWYLERTKLVNNDRSVELENVSITDLAKEKYWTSSPQYYLKIKDVENTRKGQVSPTIGSLSDISAYGSVINVESRYAQIRYSFFYPFNGNIFDRQKAIKILAGGIVGTPVVTWGFLPIYLPIMALGLIACGVSWGVASDLMAYLKSIKGLGMHEGDWEHITVVVNLKESKIEAVYYSAHYGEGQWTLPKGSSDPLYAQFSTDSSGRPKVYVARESHAAYPDPGEHPRCQGFANDLTGNSYSWDTKENIVNVRDCNQPWWKANIIWGDTECKNRIPPEVAILPIGLGSMCEYTPGPTTPSWYSSEEKGEAFLKGDPALSDTADWYKPEYYKTIQCADIDGDGKAELIARSAYGIWVWKYDSSKGWIQLRSGLSLSDAADWYKPEYYKTIQCADIDGDGKAELIARSASGIWVWKYDSSKGWTQLRSGLSLSDTADWYKPEYYETIQCADIDGDGKAELIARGAYGIWVWKYDSSKGWIQLRSGLSLSDTADWYKPEYYKTIQCADIDGDGKAELIARSASGIWVWKYDSSKGWIQLPNGPELSDTAKWNAPSCYETIQFADIDQNLAGSELIARSPTGIMTYWWPKIGH